MRWTEESALSLHEPAIKKDEDDPGSHDTDQDAAIGKRFREYHLQTASNLFNERQCRKWRC
ncbi:MAG: hypothetical protein M1510_04035 [Nitrospirae bacterium]|nr:hypothetical protein [Nitrospirota bacterium]